MNVAFYLRAFDLAADHIFDEMGLGSHYSAQGTGTCFMLETRIHYVQEVFEGNPLRITGHIVDLSDKLVHFVSEMHHAEKGYLAAATESLTAHISLPTRKTAPFPPEILARLQRIKEAQRHLPRPQGFGQPIGIRHKAKR
jgi:acyl-CoA thioester hydrolase